MNLSRLSFRSVGISDIKVEIKVKSWSIVVEGDPKTPFSLTTTPRCRGGRYFFPFIAPLYP